MLARLDYENLIQVNQAEVSEQVGMNRHNVNRSIKKLIELVIRGRRAHGAALATLPTCAHLSPDSQARLHRAGSVPCKPKTLKMSAYGTFSLLRDPQGSCQHRGRCPHPRSPRGRGAGKPPAPLPQSVGSPPTCKGQAATRLLRKP